MRPKFVVLVLLPASLIFVGLVFLKHSGHAPIPVVSNPEMTTFPVVSNTVAAVAPAPALASAPAPVVVKTVQPEEREAAIQAEKDQLYAWSMNDDPQSLSNILDDLTSPEKEIRMAAVEAAKQFGSTNAISTLKTVASSTADTQEQMAMLQAAYFLSLPELDLPAPGSGAPETQAQIQLDQDQQKIAQNEPRRLARLQGQNSAQNQQSNPNN
jgi:hypothetical protein